MRHALLIMAHHNFNQLACLCGLFNDGRFHIYLHIDSKSNVPQEILNKLLYNRNLTIIDSKSITWGGYSQVDCELRLLSAALNDGPYDRFHLLSGEDLPIKPLDYIDRFFELHSDIEYISIKESGSLSQISREVRERIDLYWPWQEIDGRVSSLRSKLVKQIQRLFPPHRILSSGVEIIGKGANWFSITRGFATYVVSKRSWIEGSMKDTKCADEVFLQTLVLNSSFKDNVAPHKDDDNLMALRLIDWNRGAPYIWTSHDIDEILQSDAMFARKFDMNRDRRLFEELCRRARE